jgi:hypothetical protein
VRRRQAAKRRVKSEIEYAARFRAGNMCTSACVWVGIIEKKERKKDEE